MGKKSEQIVHQRRYANGNKHMRRTLPSFFTRELHIKTVMRYHLIEWLKSKTLTIPNVNKDIEQQEYSVIVGGKANWYSHFGSQVAASYKARNSLLPYNPCF